MLSTAYLPAILRWFLIAGVVCLFPILSKGQSATPPTPPPDAAVATTPAAPLQTWQQAIGPWDWKFPRDHGAHPDFKTEWWYFTGNLVDTLDRKFGYQLTIFRQGVQFKPAQADSKWAVRDFYFGHLTVSDLSAARFHVAERVTRGALGEASAMTDRMDVVMGPWSIEQDRDERIQLSAREDDIAIEFTARPLKPLILEGVKGLSKKGSEDGQASYYYSYPRLETTGTMRISDNTYTVTGESWFDHEFSTSMLGKDQVGWDWFCIQLDNHEEIMLYAMRTKSGAMDPSSEGTWVKIDGSTQRIEPGSFTIEKLGTWKSTASGATYPAGWHITIPGHKADLTVTPAMSDQELHLSKMGTLDYWEGSSTIQGKVGATAVTGVGYTELTGYAGSLQPGMTDQ
jgi:predicted secreted hydrolase